MIGERARPFWDETIEPAIKPDLDSMPLYRARHFPTSAGQTPWLDLPNAEEWIDHRLRFGGCCQSNGDLSPVRRTLPYPELRLSRNRTPLGQCG